MQDYRININYAKALFMLADELGEQERVAEDMRLVNAVSLENRIFSTVFRNPEIKVSKKIAIVQDIFAQCEPERYQCLVSRPLPRQP